MPVMTNIGPAQMLGPFTQNHETSENTEYCICTGFVVLSEWAQYLRGPNICHHWNAYINVYLRTCMYINACLFIYICVYKMYIWTCSYIFRHVYYSLFMCFIFMPQASTRMTTMKGVTILGGSRLKWGKNWKLNRSNKFRLMKKNGRIL
jgi:hypothetical protein